MRQRIVCLAGATALFTTQAFAEAAETSFKASATLARGHTTNVLDAPLALSDWYTELRGSIEETLSHDLGTTKVSGEFQARLHDRYDIEDDLAAGIAVETTMRPSETFELRGTLAFRAVREGDDFAIDPVILGTSTDKQVMTAALQAGLRLDASTVLVLEGAAIVEKAGDTRFEEDVILPLRLEPDRDRFAVGATLTRTQGALAYGSQASAALTRVSAAGGLADFDLWEAKGRLQAALQPAGGASLAVAVGFDAIGLRGSDFQDVRPAYEIAGSLPLFGALALRGAFKAGFLTTSDADDPVAAWVRRVEAEAEYKATPKLSFGLGAFSEKRENIALEYDETKRGAYASAGWDFTGKTALLLRVDFTNNRVEALDFDYDTITTQVAITTRL